MEEKTKHALFPFLSAVRVARVFYWSNTSSVESWREVSEDADIYDLLQIPCCHQMMHLSHSIVKSFVILVMFSLTIVHFQYISLLKSAIPLEDRQGTGLVRLQSVLCSGENRTNSLSSFLSSIFQ